MRETLPVAAFFDAIRTQFGGSLAQPQVDGINAILEAWRRAGDGDKRKLAYLLATTRHETDNTMAPIHERGGVSYFEKYDPGTPIGKRLGNTVDGDGYRYRGRGFVQLTGRDNYRKAAAKLNADLLGSPELALQPDIAAMCLVKGCMEGWFTGKKLGDYITDNRADYVAARRVVNGTDRATDIARYAEGFEKALASLAQPLSPAPAPTPAPGPSEPVRSGWLAALVRFVAGILSAFINRR